jgi:hypothetical protein
MGLECEPGMTGRIELLPSNREAKLTRHVETGSRRWVPVDFDSGQIMNRITAALDQGKDSIQTALTEPTLNVLRLTCFALTKLPR